MDVAYIAGCYHTQKCGAGDFRYRFASANQIEQTGSGQSLFYQRQ
jgi:hypothetical protein